MKIYLLYDGSLKYSLTDDPEDFHPILVSESIGTENNANLEWVISANDEQLETITVKSLPKLEGRVPVKGSWKDTWAQKPIEAGNNQYVAQITSEATQDKPELFSYSVEYSLKGEQQINDPQNGSGTFWIPPPAPQPSTNSG